MGENERLILIIRNYETQINDLINNQKKNEK